MSSRTIKFLPAVLIFIALSVSAQPVYKWRDENGKLHFSDKPRHPSAELHEVFENDMLQIQSRTDLRPAPQSASTQRAMRPKVITASDYEINFSASQRNREVTVSGRIGNGPDCRNLLVTVHIRDGKGRTERASGAVSNVGYGRSDLIHIKKQVYYGDVFNHWNVLKVIAECTKR